MKEQFIDRKFSVGSLAIIERANLIIDEYRPQGFTLTLRQLYYQFVSRDIIPNKQSEYKRLGSILNDARLAGLVDWSSIEDRTRNLEKHSSWTSPRSIIQSAAESYREDPWLEQSFYPEVWIEKDALIGVIEPICKELRIPYFACRGYASQSEVYSAGKRLQTVRRRGREPVVFHLGDHDPSGIDMTRDNSTRLDLFARMGIEVVRLALNMDQVREYNPPPNPAKDTDSRFTGYEQEHGDESWELDALEPSVISDLIDSAVRERLDREAWDASMSTEDDGREALSEVSNRWSDVLEYLGREE